MEDKLTFRQEMYKTEDEDPQAYRVASSFMEEQLLLGCNHWDFC